MGMTPAQVAQHLGEKDYLKLCTKVARKWNQRFDILDVHRTEGARGLVTIVLENGQTKKVEI